MADQQKPRGWIVSFGKFKGTPLSELTVGEVVSYCAFLHNAAIDKGEPLGGAGATFFREVAKVFDKVVEKAKTLPPPEPYQRGETRERVQTQAAANDHSKIPF